MRPKTQREETRLVRSSKFEVRRKLLVFILLSAFSFQLLAFLGCEAMRRKFVRRPRKKKVEVIVHTQDYVSAHSQEAIYQRYYMFWRAAQQELINSLNAVEGSGKRRLFLAQKIEEHLQQMRQLLLPPKQKELDVYILEQSKLTSQLARSKLSRAQRLRAIHTLERQRRQIQKQFAPRHIQRYLREK